MRTLTTAALVLTVLLAGVPVSGNALFSDNFDDGADNGWLRSDSAPFFSVVSGEYQIHNYGSGLTLSTRPDVTLPSAWSYGVDLRAWRPNTGTMTFGGICMVADPGNPWSSFLLANACVHDSLNLIGLQIHWQTGASAIEWVPYAQGDQVHLEVTRAAGSSVYSATLTAPGGTLTSSSTSLPAKLAACKYPGVQVAGGANATYKFDNVSIASTGLSGTYVSVDGLTGVYKYASGFGDDLNIPSRTAIDFTGAIADNADKYLADASSLGSWRRSGTVLGANSSDPNNAIVYKVARPDSVAGAYTVQSGAIYLGTRIYQSGGRVSLFVSSDGVNWSPSLQTDQNSSDGWQTRLHDVAIPKEYLTGDAIYVKISGSCPAADAQASVEDWGIVLNLRAASQSGRTSSIRWAGMDLGGRPGSPTYQGNTYQDVYTLLSAIGMQGANRSADWWSTERVEGFFSWNAISSFGDPLDDSARSARNAGLLWMPQMAVHYRPFWMQGVKGATTPFDWIYPDGSTDKTHGQWSPPNFFFPGNSTYKSSLAYLERYITAFGEHFADEEPPLLGVSDGTFGEAYYGVDADVNPVSDPYTLAAWQADAPSSAMYTTPGVLCQGTADQQAFGRWWNGKLVDSYISNVHAWSADAFPEAGQILKSAVHGGMCQDVNAQMDATIPSNLQACSFGGPLRAGFAGVAAAAHQKGVAAWVESSIDDNHSVADAITYLNQDYWDCYNEAGYALFTNSDPTASFEKFTWLINACRGVLVTDGNFESGAASWSTDDARTASWGTSTSLSAVGSYGVRVSTDSRENASIRSAAIAVAPGMEYSVGVFAFSGASRTCSVLVREYNASSAIVAEHSSVPVCTAGARYIYHSFVTAAQTATIRISLCVFGASGNAYFDYVTLRGANLANASFESGATGWTRESGGGWGVSSSGAHDGAQCAFLTGNAAAGVLVSPSVPCLGVRHRYWVSCWAKSTGGESVILCVREYDGSGALLKTTGYGCMTSADWRYVSHSFTPDTRTVSYRVCLEYLGASGTAFFDGVRIQISPLWNHGFENGTDGTPDGWTAAGAPAAWGQSNYPSVGTAPAICTEGQHGLFVDGGASGEGASAALNVTPGRSYRVGCFANGTDVAVRVAQCTASGIVLATQQTGRTNTGGKFRYLEQLITADSDAAYFTVSLLNYLPQRAYFDDVRVDTLETALALGTISGVVTDAESGNPIAGAEIAAPGGAAACSNPDGTYSLKRAPGQYTLTVLRDGYITGRSPRLTVASAGGVNASVALHRSNPVIGAAFTDTFARADSSQLGATLTGGLTWEGSNCQIQGGRVRMTGAASFWPRNVTPDRLDVTIRVRLNAADPASWVGLAYRERRLNDVAGQNYLVYITPDGTLRLFYDYGVVASATVPVGGWSGFHRIRVRAVASSHKVWWDQTADTDTPVLNVTDTRKMAPGFMEVAASCVGTTDEALIDDIISLLPPDPNLTQDYLSVNGTTGVYKYASGFGDDNIIPGHTAIDFSGAIANNAEKYLSDAYSLGRWYRNGTQLGSFSNEPANSIIYKVSLPAEGAPGYVITGGQAMLCTRLYEQGANVAMYVSRDGVVWSAALVADQKLPPNSWVVHSQDAVIPSAFVGGDTIYVKITGSCSSANDWASVEDWGIRLELRAISTAAQVVRLADLTGLADGTAVNLTAPMIVAVGSGTLTDGSCYVQEPLRARGIKVAGSPVITLGDAVSIDGVLTTDSRGERMIGINSVKSRVSGAAPRALWMSNTDASDPAAAGLLVSVWGRVTYTSPDGTFAYLDDGSSLSDGTGHTGIRVQLEEQASPIVKAVQNGDFAAVTGAAGLARDGVLSIRTIRPRGDSDVLIF